MNKFLNYTYGGTIIASVFGGSIYGSIDYYSEKYKPEHKKLPQILDACIMGGISGAFGGFAYGLLSPISVPTTVCVYGYDICCNDK